MEILALVLFVALVWFFIRDAMANKREADRQRERAKNYKPPVDDDDSDDDEGEL